MEKLLENFIEISKDIWVIYAIVGVMILLIIFDRKNGNKKG